MGLFGGSTTTKTNEQFDTGPSSWQQPYLDDAFTSAKDTYSGSKGTPYYQGETYGHGNDESNNGSSKQDEQDQPD